MTSTRKRLPLRAARSEPAEAGAERLAPCPSHPRRRGRPAPRLVLALERPRHPVRSPDRLEGRRVAQLLHGLDRPPRGVAASWLRLPLSAERGRFLRRRPRRADHHQQDPGRARPDRDPQGDGAPRRSTQGRRWNVPHNFYRVKDHGDDFTLCPADVLRVADLADARPGGLPLCAPRLLAALRPDRRRQRLGPHPGGGAPHPGLAATRGQGRRRGGSGLRPDPGRPRRPPRTPRPRQARSIEPATPPFFVPTDGDDAAIPAEHNDSASVTTSRHDGERNLCCHRATLVSATMLDRSNKGSRADDAALLLPPTMPGNRCCTEQHDVSPIIDYNEDVSVSRKTKTPYAENEVVPAVPGSHRQDTVDPAGRGRGRRRTGRRGRGVCAPSRAPTTAPPPRPSASSCAILPLGSNR